MKCDVGSYPAQRSARGTSSKLREQRLASSLGTDAISRSVADGKLANGVRDHCGHWFRSIPHHEQHCRTLGLNWDQLIFLCLLVKRMHLFLSFPTPAPSDSRLIKLSRTEAKWPFSIYTWNRSYIQPFFLKKKKLFKIQITKKLGDLEIRESAVSIFTYSWSAPCSNCHHSKCNFF